MGADDLPVVLRAMRADDRSCVVATWTHGVCPSLAAHLRDAKARDIERRVARGTVLVAVLDTDDDTILGWACMRGPSTIDYVYVKPPYRRAGLASRLVAPVARDGVVVVATSKPVGGWMPAGWEYDPWA